MEPIFGQPKTQQERLMEMLRVANIFAPTAPSEPELPEPPIGVPPPQTSVAIPPGFNVPEYTPETEMTEMFKRHMAAYPQRNNPSLGRKIVAAMASLSGTDPDKIKYAPYYQALEDWQNKMQPLTAGMTQERMGNQQERMFAQSAMTQQRLAQSSATTAEIARARLALQQYKAANPNMQSVEHQGLLYVFDPASGEYIPSGIGEKDLSDLEKIQYGFNNALDLIGAREDAQGRLIDQRQVDALERLGVQQQNALGRIGAIEGNIRTRPGRSTAVTNALTPEALRTLVRGRAERAVREHPEWREFIIVDRNGAVSVADPVEPNSGYFGTTFGQGTGPTPDDRTTILRYLDTPQPGEGLTIGGVPGGAQQQQPAAPTVPAEAQPTLPQGAVPGTLQPTSTSSAGRGGAVTGAGALPPPPISGPPPPPLPQRTVGMVSTLGNGGIGRWTGTGWELVTWSGTEWVPLGR